MTNLPATTAPHIPVRAYTGGQITEPGIYSGVSMDDYHGANICDGPSVSSTILRKVESESMDEVWLIWPGNPDRAETKEKEEWIKGRARHTLFLGEQGFRENFVIRPAEYTDTKTGEVKKWNGNAIVCKKWLAEAKLEKKGVLPPEELEDIRGAASRLAAHPTIQQGLLNGLVEHSIFWKDAKTGLWLKARPDVIPTESAMVADYKGTRSAQSKDVRKAIGEYGYHQQLALVAEGLRVTAGLKVTDFFLIFQKWTAPYSINIKPLTPHAINRGYQQNRRALDKLALAIETGVWPGPDDDEVAAGLPDWLEKRLKEDEEAHELPTLADVDEADATTPTRRRRRSEGSRALDAAFPDGQTA